MKENLSQPKGTSNLRDNINQALKFLNLFILPEIRLKPAEVFYIFKINFLNSELIFLNQKVHKLQRISDSHHFNELLSKLALQSNPKSLKHQRKERIQK